MSDEHIVAPHAKWVKASLYCAMTGHTKFTLSENRRNGIWKYGTHYKHGPDSKKIYYYNVAAIDKLIDKERL